MFTLFRRGKKENEIPAELHPNAVNRMSLEQRKVYRQEMLYRGIREAFLSLDAVSSMYKLKVFPIDDRHHRFVAMIDIAKSFISGTESKARSFSDLEKWLRRYNYDRYGVLVTGVYWRISESVKAFDHPQRSTDANNPNTRALSQTRQEVDRDLLARNDYQPASPQDAHAFMEALRQGVEPPVVHIGNMEYKSDLMPLEEGVMIGGTQYGKIQ
jgi:hypothetical protein